MFNIEVSQKDNTATIQVKNSNGDVEADLYVEVYNGVPRLVLTHSIIERDSDEPVTMINLLNGKTLSF